MIDARELLKYDLEPIPKYLLMRDVLKVKRQDEAMLSLKSKVLGTRMVQEIVKCQLQDGSWGRFHSMDSSSGASGTTETALRRLLILGLDKDDEPIGKSLCYMEKHLSGEVELRDRREVKHDWDLFTRLIVATWVLKIQPSNEKARTVAKEWASVVSHAFSKGKYDDRAYKEAYISIHRPEKGKTIIGFQNYYLVAMLPGFLEPTIEARFLDYIMTEDRGIYYIYDGSLRARPVEFSTKQASRYLYAYELLSHYNCVGEKIKDFIVWINENSLDDGFWDMGQGVRDRIHFPLSNTWRNPLNRKLDCTVRVLRILSNIQKKQN